LKLSEDVRSELRFFAFYLANGTLHSDILPGTQNYSSILSEASALEQIFAIWANVLELDESGKVTNAAQASRRAAQYIRSLIDGSYFVEPPFEDWELDLHI
jgi:hypothetical protein